MNLLFVPSLQYVWDRILGGFKHKNNRTREGVCLCLIATLNTWVKGLLDVESLLPGTVDGPLFPRLMTQLWGEANVLPVVSFWRVGAKKLSRLLGFEILLHVFATCVHPSVCLLWFLTQLHYINSRLPDMELKVWPSIRLFLTYVTCWETPRVR